MLIVNISNATGFTPSEAAKLQDAVEVIQAVVNGDAFKQEVLGFKFQNRGGLSNQEIYDLFMSGSEVLQPQEDQEMDVDINMYYRNNNVIGYTYANTIKTWINRKYYSLMSPDGIAANIVHEWTHKLGFGHDYYATEIRPFSVPYAIGNMVQRIDPDDTHVKAILTGGFW